MTKAAIGVRPANEVDWPALRTVFGRRGQGSVCWCQRYKLGPGEAFKHVAPESRAERLRARPIPGSSGSTGCPGPGGPS